jgi:hypothetical protein
MPCAKILAARGAWACVKPCLTAVACQPSRHSSIIIATWSRFFNKLKHFRAIATRYDKTPENFLAAIQLASARIWMRYNESVA